MKLGKPFDFKFVDLHVKEEIAYLTINRPEAMNAIDVEMHELLWDTWKDFRDDDAVELAIVTGAGDEAFSAGADLKTHAPMWLETADALLPRRKMSDGIGGITRGLHRSYKPIIAAVNGWALAGGLEYALACDIRIASEKAMFGSFEVRRGYHHGDGGIVRLVNTCGVGLALEMLLTGETVSAQEAFDIGLVNKIVDREALFSEAETLAGNLAGKAPIALRYVKEAVNKGLDLTLEQGLRLEADLYFLLHTTTDRTEGIRAFQEKRSPDFKGQ